MPEGFSAGLVLLSQREKFNESAGQIGVRWGVWMIVWEGCFGGSLGIWLVFFLAKERKEKREGFCWKILERKKFYQKKFFFSDESNIHLFPFTYDFIGLDSEKSLNEAIYNWIFLNT